MNFILRADAGEDAVNNANFRFVSRDETADLCQQCDDGNLANIGRFASHVRPGDDVDTRLRVEQGVVGGVAVFC